MKEKRAKGRMNDQTVIDDHSMRSLRNGMSWLLHFSHL